MLRVLLLLEDYGEQVFLQILLSKLGFDVGTMKNPKVLYDTMMNMNPDVVVLTAKGKRVNGVELSSQIRKINGRPKVMLITPLQLRDKLTKAELANAEALLESPINPPSFLDLMAQLMGVAPEPLIEKYHRMKPQLAAKNPDFERAVNDGAEASGGSRLEIIKGQAQRYEKFLVLKEPPAQQVFSKSKVTEVVKEIRREPPDSQLDEERQAFVRAMFKKTGE